MTLDLSIADLLTALLTGGAVVVGLAVGVALVVRGGPHAYARRLLGGFLVAGALSVSNELIGALELHRLSDHFWITPLLYTLALGPLLYAFVRARLDASWRAGWRRWPHVVLPLYQAGHELFSGLTPVAVKAWFWQTPYARAYDALDTWVFALSFGLYLAAAARRLRRPRGDAETGRWLRRLVRGCALILAIAVGVDLVHVASAELGAGVDWLQLGSSAGYSALLYWTAFTGWASVHRAPAPAPRRETYGVTEADLRAHADALRALVAAERPHLDPGLTLGGLARQLGLSDKELSYVLNEGVGTGYTAYVNGLRVGEAARRLGDAAHADETVLQIALASGFASKATFNRAFKQTTGQTPSVYRAAQAAAS